VPPATDSTPTAISQYSVIDSNNAYVGAVLATNGPDYVVSFLGGRLADLVANGYSPDNYPCLDAGQAYSECQIRADTADSSTYGFVDSACTMPAISSAAPPPISNSIIYIAESARYFLYSTGAQSISYVAGQKIYALKSGACVDSGKTGSLLQSTYFTDYTNAIAPGGALLLATPLSFTQSSL
jgi:hypothetical protein